MELDIPRIHLINSILPNRNENEERFIQIELEYQYTNISRLRKLLNFLAKARMSPYDFEPCLLFIRNEKEDIWSIYQSAKSMRDGIVDARADDIEYAYWSNEEMGYGV